VSGFNAVVAARGITAGGGTAGTAEVGSRVSAHTPHPTLSLKIKKIPSKLETTPRTPRISRSILFSSISRESVNSAENPPLDLPRPAPTGKGATAGRTSPTSSRSQCTVSHVIHGGSHRCGGRPFPHPAPRFLYPQPLTSTPSPDSGHRIQDSVSSFPHRHSGCRVLSTHPSNDHWRNQI
jgi:hypothetical protein